MLAAAKPGCRDVQVANTDSKRARLSKSSSRQSTESVSARAILALVASCCASERSRSIGHEWQRKGPPERA
jgi:hypothetical protein